MRSPHLDEPGAPELVKNDIEETYPEVWEVVTSALETRTTLGVAMALTRIAASIVLHDGGDEDSFKSINAAAWKHTEHMHGIEDGVSRVATEETD